MTPCLATIVTGDAKEPGRNRQTIFNELFGREKELVELGDLSLSSVFLRYPKFWEQGKDAMHVIIKRT